MSCPCDDRVSSPTLLIPAGLTEIPRQIATFSDFRQALLAELGKHPALTGWKPRSADDFGVMLLEMWACVADSLAFYDEVIAHEVYLRTARCRPSLARLVELLGYVPRPAVAASVHLAALADGRKAVELAAGTAFRSGAFSGEAPQIFELTDGATIHPLANRWKVSAPRPKTVAEAFLGPGGDPSATVVPPRLLVDPKTAGALKAGGPILVHIPGHSPKAFAATVASIEEIEGQDGGSYLGVTLSPPISLTGGTSLADIRLLGPTQTAGLWQRPTASGGSGSGGFFSGGGGGSDFLFGGGGGGGGGEFFIGGDIEAVLPAGGGNLSIAGSGGSSLASLLAAIGNTVGGQTLTLDGLHRQIRPGDFILVSKGSAHRWFEITAVHEVQLPVSEGGTSTAIDADGDEVTINAPVVKAPFTRLTLDVSLNAGARKGPGGASWDEDDAPQITVRYLPIAAGEVTAELALSLPESTSELALGATATGRRFETPAAGDLPTTFLLRDRDETGALASGALDPATRKLTLATGSTWSTPLVPPLTVYGNVLTASRGETVSEILGSGDASVASQSFKLKKSPLTYLASPTAGNDQGVVSTLTVRVDGVLWREVASFYGVGPGDPVYTVRQNEDEESIVTFGDGIRGRRLASGSGNVVATYRFGAGEAAPPAGSIAQLARPVPGLSGIVQPLAAFGGADREEASQLRTYAPRSALLLGRAVSLADFEAAAAGVPGVEAVRAEWRWSGRGQRPVIHLYYIGAEELQPTVTATLRNLAEPGVPLSVEAAEAVPIELALDLEIDPAYLAEDVLAAVRDDLLDGETGFLLAANLGIGAPLIRSRLVERVLGIEGTVAVRDLRIGSFSFTGTALAPGAGRYYDFENGSLILNGEEI